MRYFGMQASLLVGALSLNLQRFKHNPGRGHPSHLGRMAGRLSLSPKQTLAGSKEAGVIRGPSHCQTEHRDLRYLRDMYNLMSWTRMSSPTSRKRAVLLDLVRRGPGLWASRRMASDL